MEQMDKDVKTAIIEMFRRVGLDYTWDQIMEYADNDPEWYWSKTWTEADENDFKRWLEVLFYKSKAFKMYPAKARKNIVKKEVGYFLLMWSWRIGE